MISSQMLKGILEYCILKIIEKEESYGYEIVQQLKSLGLEDMTEGTVYPLLLRLEKNDYIAMEMRKSELGPKRKYYHITPTGKEELKGFSQSWKELSHIVNKVFTASKESSL